jgi:hypothetical protein
MFVRATSTTGEALAPSPPFEPDVRGRRNRRPSEADATERAADKSGESKRGKWDHGRGREANADARSETQASRHSPLDFRGLVNEEAPASRGRDERVAGAHDDSDDHAAKERDKCRLSSRLSDTTDGAKTPRDSCQRQQKHDRDACAPFPHIDVRQESGRLACCHDGNSLRGVRAWLLLSGLNTLLLGESNREACGNANKMRRGWDSEPTEALRL